jgi:proprotein convertase subtilisin/kexin type 5
MNLGTTLHEITHILGFSATSFLKFVNPNTGVTLNKSDIIEPATLRGFETNIIKTPKVREVARKHFGCPNALGVEVENQGGGGSLGSHWERTHLMNEVIIISK